MIHRIKRTTLLLFLIFVSETVESTAIRDTIQAKYKLMLDREVIDESNYERDLAKTKKTKAPTAPKPKTKAPVRIPSHPPSISSHPSNSPYPTLSRSPSEQPSISFHPTNIPSQLPSQVPSSSSAPTISAIPTKAPSFLPSKTPTFTPTALPSISPTQEPSLTPSYKPSNLPSESPSNNPTNLPSHSPSKLPSSKPSFKPSNLPTKTPSTNPTKLPSHSPSKTPSITPSFKPSNVPSKHPTSSPSYNPTLSVEPTNSPTISHEPTLVVIQEIDLIKFNVKIYFDMTQTQSQPPQGRHRRLRLNGQGNDKYIDQGISSEQDVSSSSSSSSSSRQLDSISINEDVLFKKLYQILNNAYGNNIQYYSDVGLIMEYEQSSFEDIYMVVTYLIGGTISFAVSNFKFIPTDDKVLSIALDALNNQSQSLNVLASASSEPIFMVKAEELVEPSSNNSNNGTIVEGTGSQIKISTITVIACSVAAVSTVIAFGLLIMNRRRGAEESDEEYEPAEPETSPSRLGVTSPTGLNRLNPLNILSISPTSNSLDANNKSRRYFKRLKSDIPDEGKSKSKQKHPTFISTHHNYSDEESSLEAPSGVDISLQGDSEVDNHSLANMSALDEVRLNAALNIPDETSIDSGFTGGSRTTLTSFSRVWRRRIDHSHPSASFPTQCANTSPSHKIIRTETMRRNDIYHDSDFSSPRFVKSPITPGDYSISTFETAENFAETPRNENRSRLESRCSLDLAREYDHFDDSLYNTDNSSLVGDNKSVSESDDSMILLAKLSTGGTPNNTTTRNQNVSKVYYGDNEEELSIASSGDGDESVFILADDDASNQSNHSDTSVQAKLAHEMYVQSLRMVQDGLNGSRISSEDGSVSSVDAGRLINETSLVLLGDNDDMYTTMILKTNISMNMIRDMESNSKDTDHDTDSKTYSCALEAAHSNPSTSTLSVLTHHEDTTNIYKSDGSFNNSGDQNITADLRMETMSFESPINRMTKEQGEKLDDQSESSYEYVGEANVSSPDKEAGYNVMYDSCLEKSLHDSIQHDIDGSGTTECHNNLTLASYKEVSKSTDYVKEQICGSTCDHVPTVADVSYLLDSVATHDLKDDNDDLISLEEEDDDDILLSEDEESASENFVHTSKSSFSNKKSDFDGTNDSEKDDMIPNTQDDTKQTMFLGEIKNMNNSVSNNLSTQVVINDSLHSTSENNQDVDCDYRYVGNIDDDDDMYENPIVAMNETTCAVVDVSIRSENYKLLVDNVESYIIDEKSKKIPE